MPFKRKLTRAQRQAGIVRRPRRHLYLDALPEGGITFGRDEFVLHFPTLLSFGFAPTCWRGIYGSKGR